MAQARPNKSNVRFFTRGAFQFHVRTGATNYTYVRTYLRTFVRNVCTFESQHVRRHARLYVAYVRGWLHCFVGMTPTASRAHDSLEDTVNLILGIITESHRAFKAQLEDLTANVLALQAESTKEINLRRKETEKVEALASDVLALKAEITEKGKTQKFPNEEKIHEILRDFNKHIDNNIKDRLGLFGDGMIIRQNNHNSEVNRQRVEFEKRIESEWLYWREVTADQIQKKWDHVANRGSAALTRLENRIQSNFNIHLQDTKRQIKAMRKKCKKTDRTSNV